MTKRDDKASGGRHHSNFAFKIISLMHDNPLLPIIRNPYKVLDRAGLKSGQVVLEVGCGPGFFTIPAADIVGEKGMVYAVDVHPLAIERVKNKIRKKGIENVTPILASASDTGLPDGSVDLSFLIGLPYVAGGLDSVLSEMFRIMKPGGMLSIAKTRGSAKNLIKATENRGFTYTEKRGRMFIFRRKDGS
jgi:ubiquinone/menaquinone biosynthesis C-methylase UbiE